MKRSIPWSDKNDDDDDSSSSSDSESDPEPSSQTKPPGKSGRRKTGGIDFETLKRHGYKGGLSVLSVPPPKDEKEPDWSWSTGKEGRKTGEAEETYQERQKTRAAIMEAEQLTDVQTSKDKKSLSFSQKEKRKRDLGQASRGKNYVEEEKRMLRESGVYSGFDS